MADFDYDIYAKDYFEMASPSSGEPSEEPLDLPSEESIDQPSEFNQNLDVEDLQAVQMDDWQEEAVLESQNLNVDLQSVNFHEEQQEQPEEVVMLEPSVPTPSNPKPKTQKLPNFRKVYGAPEPEEEEVTDGKYQRDPMPYVLIIALALLNAKGKALGTQELYNFFITHFKKYNAENNNNWKGTARTKLAKTPKMFTKVAGEGKLQGKYTLNLTEDPNWLKKELRKIDNQRFFAGRSINFLGLVDPTVWSAMMKGTLGLPRMRSTDKRLTENKTRRIQGPVHDPNGVQSAAVPQVAYPPPSANEWLFKMPNQQLIYPAHIFPADIFQLDFSQFDFRLN